eukprot:TRINITY_DN10720_c0_g1_i1.p1 TRINITY_DN10720_c0_g1~~TRINITY_DN10720_c0_g1_i1.p1  ORF type:complete len:299 (+),score=5.05 TRINITY_DN10720_c0_g1_i1:2-898(+)
MDWSRRTLFAFIALASLAPHVLNAEPIASTSRGVFYAFADGQVVLIDPTRPTAVASIRSFSGSGIPFPNKCPFSPFRGKWRSVDFGPAQRTLWAAASYDAVGPERVAHLEDGIHVIDTVAAEMSARIPLNATPESLFFMPMANEVWVHAADVADRYSFTILSAKPPYPINHPYGINSLFPVGRARVLQDYNMNTRAYLTSQGSGGVYIVDTARPSDVGGVFIPFEPTAAFRDLACPGVWQSAYARTLRHAFFSCAAPFNATAIPKDLATVQVDLRTDALVAVWPFAGDLYLTPDDSFL